MEFNYGDTLRIRNELYTILGKIRYIDMHRGIWYKYKLVKHKNNAEFWISWNKKRGVYQFTKLCGKELPSDMNVVHRGYQMAIATRGDIDIDIADVARYEAYEDVNGTHIFTIEKWAHMTEYSKGFYIHKEYVSVEKDVETTDAIKDRMDTVKKIRFVGPIVWILANVLIFMPRFDIQILNDIHGFLTWPYIVGGNIILGIIVALVLFKR